MSRRLSDDEKRVFSDQISLLKNENERLTKRLEDAEDEVDKWINKSGILQGELTLLEAKNEALMELAGTYIKAYEDIAFADALIEVDDGTE